MPKDVFKEIKELIGEFQESLAQLLPALEQEVDKLIQSKCSDKNIIEITLDTLLSLIDMGIGKDLFIKLLEYYKTIDLKGAVFYWNEYDNDDME